MLIRRGILVSAFLLCASCGSNSASNPGDGGVAPAEGGGPAEGSAPTEGGAKAGTPLPTTADGPSVCNGAGLADGGSCPTKTPGTTTIIGSVYSQIGSTIAYGTAPDQWDVWSFAASGQPAPTVTATAGAVAISASLTPGGGSVGFGASVHGAQCVNERNFASGLAFSLSGALGGCSLYVDALASDDESAAYDACRGSCAAPGPCTPATLQVTTTGSVMIPNMSFAGGSPTGYADVTSLIGFRWRLEAPASGTGCSANLVVSDVQFLASM